MNQADAIRQKLREIEAANQVKILYAVESGTCDMCSFAQ